MDSRLCVSAGGNSCSCGLQLLGVDKKKGFRVSQQLVLFVPRLAKSQGDSSTKWVRAREIERERERESYRGGWVAINVELMMTSRDAVSQRVQCKREKMRRAAGRGKMRDRKSSAKLGLHGY